MLRFDHAGQGFVSALYQDDLTALLEASRRAVVCRTQDASPAINRFAGVAHAFIGFRLQYANAYVLHEYAHAEVARQQGAQNVHVGISDGTPNPESSYLANLMEMAFQPRQLFNLKQRSVGVTGTGGSNEPTDRIQADAAGLNLNSYFGQHHFAAMLDGDTSPSRALAYTVNKWFSPVYFELDKTIGGDPSAYVADLATQGVATSKQAIQRYQLAAALLSNGSWTSLRALRDYGASAGSHTTPLGWRVDALPALEQATLYWPEFSTFLNTGGVSLAGQTTLDVRHGATWSVGLERNVIGLAQGTDVSLGLRQQFGATRVATRLTANAGHTFVQLQGQHPLTPSLALTGLLYANHGATLAGQRLAYRSKSGGYVGLDLSF